jgi:hypothetical protein
MPRYLPFLGRSPGASSANLDRSWCTLIT